MSAALLWFSGLFFMAMGVVSARIKDRVTHEDGSPDDLGGKIAAWAAPILVIIGALCWRVA